MSSGGQNRKTRGAKIINGTFRKDRNPKKELQSKLLTDIPKVPETLNRFGAAKWKEICRELIANEVLTVLDLPALEMCCVAYSDFCEAHDAVHYRKAKNGKKVRQSIAQYMAGRNSQTMPEYTAYKQAFTLYKSFMTEFGLSPVARNRIDISKTSSEADPIGELIGGANA